MYSYTVLYWYYYPVVQSTCFYFIHSDLFRWLASYLAEVGLVGWMVGIWRWKRTHTYMTLGRGMSGGKGRKEGRKREMGVLI